MLLYCNKHIVGKEALTDYWTLNLGSAGTLDHVFSLVALLRGLWVFGSSFQMYFVDLAYVCENYSVLVYQSLAHFQCKLGSVRSLFRLDPICGVHRQDWKALSGGEMCLILECLDFIFVFFVEDVVPWTILQRERFAAEGEETRLRVSILFSEPMTQLKKVDSSLLVMEICLCLKFKSWSVVLFCGLWFGPCLL